MANQQETHLIQTARANSIQALKNKGLNPMAVCSSLQQSRLVESSSRRKHCLLNLQLQPNLNNFAIANEVQATDLKNRIP